MTTAVRRFGRDPGLWLTVLVLWALLGLFVLFPLARLSWIAFFDGGRLSLGPAWTVLGDPNHRHAFFNSLLLAALVGVGGTALASSSRTRRRAPASRAGGSPCSTPPRSCRSSHRPSRRPSR